MKIMEHEKPWFFLGYALKEGDCWVLIGMEEADADQCLQEYTNTGKVTLKLLHGRSSEVIEPCAVAKLSSDKVFYAIKEEGV